MPRGAEVTNVKQLAAFSLRVRAVSPTLGAELNKALRKVGQPALADARRAAMSIPSQGRGSTGLRRAIAQSLSLRVSTSVSRGGMRIAVDPKRMPAGKGALPRLLEGPQDFRHKVFGNPDEWVSQQAHPWFNPTMERHQGRIIAGVQQVAESIFQKLRKAHK